MRGLESLHAPGPAIVHTLVQTKLLAWAAVWKCLWVGSALDTANQIVWGDAWDFRGMEYNNSKTRVKN